jgi:hypothetical protein
VLEVNNSQQAYKEHDGTGTTLFEGQMHSIESFKISKPNIKRENGEYGGWTKLVCFWPNSLRLFIYFHILFKNKEGLSQA